MSNDKINVPKRVFIVPYRNRAQHKFFFSKYMSFILEDQTDYEIYFSHQCDPRTFNRGATRNIGFLAVKDKYPQHYKDIIFIFNDVDTIPFNKIFDYQTTQGVVKHYYGYKYALGGIVVVKGSDFEKINGYPCYWGWGMEDNALQKRCEGHGLRIDRSVFYTIGSPEILQLFDGVSRIISKKDPWRSDNDNGVDGLKTIHDLVYNVSDKSDNPNDNIFAVHNPKIFYINISTFLTSIRFEGDNYYKYDLREPPRKIVHPDKLRETKQIVTITDNWTNIPYYPTTKERRENIAKYLMSQGKEIPQNLLAKMEEDRQKEIDEDVFNNFSQNAEQNVNNSQPQMQQKIPINQFSQFNPSQQYKTQTAPNKFSQQYAQYVGAKPRAQASARVRLGGAF